MKETKVIVVDPVGLHARPATVAVNAANMFKSTIDITFRQRTVNMKSIRNKLVDFFLFKKIILKRKDGVSSEDN